jgi:hypothetical protein
MICTWLAHNPLILLLHRDMTTVVEMVTLSPIIPPQDNLYSSPIPPIFYPFVCLLYQTLSATVAMVLATSNETVPARNRTLLQLTEVT